MTNNRDKDNNNKYVCRFSFSYLIFISLIIFLLNVIIILDFIYTSHAQNLSSTISLKANAGEDQYVEEGKPVILNAEDSVSSDPPIDSYNWFQVEPKDPQINLENSNTARASFTSPNLPNDGNIVFQLIVKDGNITDTDTVNIYVVKDLSSINKLKEEGGFASYQLEICFDGGDNDRDGKVDVQDEDCGMTFVPQSPNQRPFQPQTGGIPFNPNFQGGQQGQLSPGQISPESQPQQVQPGQLQPGQGQIIP